VLTCDIDSNIKAYTAAVNYVPWSILGRALQPTINNKVSGVLLPLVSLSRGVYNSLLPHLTIPGGYRRRGKSLFVWYRSTTGQRGQIFFLKGSTNPDLHTKHPINCTFDCCLVRLNLELIWLYLTPLSRGHNLRISRFTGTQDSTAIET
jgi:hypothetical protein